MTTAFVEPFGLIFDSNGAGSGNFTPSYSVLPQGVHTIMITWNGTALLRVHRSPEQVAATRTEIGQIPAGTGRRSLVITGLGVKAGENAFLSFTTASAEIAGQRATAQVTTLPLKTAGG